jgi:hypothetical protein
MSHKTHRIFIMKFVQRNTFRKIRPVYFENYLKLSVRYFECIYFNPAVLCDYSAQFTIEETFRDKRSVFLLLNVIFSV